MHDEIVKNRHDVAEFTTAVEIMKSNMNFPNIKPPKNIGAILDIVSDTDAIRKLSGEQVAEYSVVLSAYSLYLGMEENRYTTFLNWCEGNMAFIVGKFVQDVDGYGFNEKNAYIRANEEHAVELNAKKLMAETKLTTIKFLSGKMDILAKQLQSLAYEKGRRKSNES